MSSCSVLVAGGAVPTSNTAFFTRFMLLLVSAIAPTTINSCDILADYGARAGNLTADARHNAAAITAALAACYSVAVPPGKVFKIAPIVLPSHRTLELGEGSSLVGSDDWTHYGTTRFMPPMGSAMQLRPLISALNATNITITGANGTIDGNGWFAWPAANWSSPECGLHGRCIHNVFFGEPAQQLRPPHVLTFTSSTFIVLRNVTVRNPAFWGIQHFYCNNTKMSHVTILAPRWTRQIAGFMPWSVLDYAVEDSYVHVGDDAVAIMSGTDEAGKVWPTSRLRFKRLFVRGRSVAVGSADSGNVTDVLFEDCTIGDVDGSSPWAIKIKMHVNVASHVSGMMFRNVKLGNITSNTWQDSKPYPAIQMGMNYGNVAVDPTKGQPTIRNISFVNVSATETSVAGSFVGATEGSISELHFQQCTFRSTARTPWSVTNVSTGGCTSKATSPPFPTTSDSPFKRNRKSLDLTLTACSSAPQPANQTFKMLTIPPFVNPAGVSAGKFCFEIASNAASLSSAVQAFGCGRNQINSRVNQYWQVVNSTLQSLQLEAPSCFGISQLAAQATLMACNDADAQFDVKLPGMLIHKPSGMCVTLADGGAPPPVGPIPPHPKVTPRPFPTPSPPTPLPKENVRPCDIYAHGGTPCVAAHSTTRALFSAFDGMLYEVRRASDLTFKSIGVVSKGGVADAAVQDVFCAHTDCVIQTIFDQTKYGNDLKADHPGRHYPVDRGVNASFHPVTLDNKNAVKETSAAAASVYGAWFDSGMGYRNDNTTAIAVMNESESMYAVMGGNHTDAICCFDYGNAENHIGADGAGTMEAIYFGTDTGWMERASKSWAEGLRKANWSTNEPILMADMEAGMYAGNDTFNPDAYPLSNVFSTLMLKGQPHEMMLKAGDAQKGELMVKYDGVRPTHDAGYGHMSKQGGLVLGTGGDDSDRSMGSFYEGAVTRGFATDAVDAGVQANVVAAGYRL